MKKKVLFRALTFTVLFLVISGGVLFYHVYTVTQKRNDFRTTRQLSRIDFTQPIDSLQALQLRQYVASMHGVENAYFNFESQVLVYTYDNTAQSSSTVYEAVMNRGNFKAVKYQIEASEAAKGCPAIGTQKNLFISLFN
jgi:hypothetical protein